MARTSIRERPDREEVLWPVQKLPGLRSSDAPALRELPHPGDAERAVRDCG